MSNTTRLFIAIAIIIVVVISFGAGYFVRAQIPASYPEGLDIVAEVWNQIETSYVAPSALNTANMSVSAIQGIIKALNDPYTTYLSKSDYKRFSASLHGNYEGIGAYVSLQSGNLTVVSLIPGSPAEQAGLKAGDVIEAVGGQNLAGMSLEEAISLIRGPEGTSVNLTVLHEGTASPVVISITRAKLDVPSATLKWQGDIAVIAITQFTETTPNEITSIIQQINANANAKGIVLDLRNNPGGLLTAVVDVASHFITSGIIVEVQNHNGTIAKYKAEKMDDTTSLPMVVLVNHASGSGSEVLSGALQDHQRALIAGETTFGKGSVDNLYQLDDGSGLYLTIMRWLTPDGQLIEGKGITPNVHLDLTGQAELDWAVNRLNNGK